ncbi:MAG: hypothetical protein M1837_006105 [Sclerophora amabilis]|nr:MAG: hypothetical protein M1837_006105 [Sclerophora amabilis]
MLSRIVDIRKPLWGFGKLPPEIRLMIHEESLISSEIIEFDRSRGFQSAPGGWVHFKEPGLVETPKADFESGLSFIYMHHVGPHLSAEAAEVFYGNNTFSVASGSLSDFFETTRESYSPEYFIRRLIVDVRTISWDADLGHPSEQLRRLLALSKLEKLHVDVWAGRDSQGGVKVDLRPIVGILYELRQFTRLTVCLRHRALDPDEGMYDHLRQDITSWFDTPTEEEKHKCELGKASRATRHRVEMPKWAAEDRRKPPKPLPAP